MNYKINIPNYIKINYRNIGQIKTIKRLRRLNLNSINFYVKTTKGQFVLRNFIDGSEPKKIQQMCIILQSCTKKRAKVMKPIKNKHQKYVDSKSKTFLTKYYPGVHFKGTNTEIKDLSKNIAILHMILAKNRIKYNFRPSEVNYKILTQQEFQILKKKIKNKNVKSSFEFQVLKNLAFISKCSLNILNSEIHFKAKKQLIHHDLHPGNVIFNRNKVTAILDFSSMRKGLVLEDIAFASFRFAFEYAKSPQQINRKIKLFVENYKNHNDINENQLHYIDYYFRMETLRRISFILKKKYFANSDMWSSDFQKQIKLLKLSDKFSIKDF